MRFHLTVPYVTPTEIVNGREQPLSSLKVHATALSPSMDSCAGQIEVKECSVNINAHSYENRSKYDNENWGEVYNVTLSHIDTDEYAVETSSLISLTTMENRNGIFNALSENITVYMVFTVHCNGNSFLHDSHLSFSIFKNQQCIFAYVLGTY